jgi:AcrR family transcriptional regulator
MTDMSTPYEQEGRSAQKRRTREALVAAARALVAAGSTPSVDEAAAAAEVSRATAYRYFPTQRDLLLAAHPETEATTMLPADAPDDPAGRLDAVIVAFTSMVLDTEAQQRTMLRLSLETDPTARGELPLRQGRAIGWITEALSDLEGELGTDALHRLVVAIRATTGIEALVWLIDVAGCSREEAVDVVRSSAQALLEHARRRPPRAAPRGGVRTARGARRPPPSRT